jgi:hypothetical protein
MNTLSKLEQKLYSKLCDTYNDKNLQRFCSLQNFIESRIKTAKTPEKATALQNVLNYAENDF